MQTKIWCITTEGREEIIPLLNVATDPVNEGGKRIENGWIINATRQFNPDGTREVQIYNDLITEAMTNGFTDILINFKETKNE